MSKSNQEKVVKNTLCTPYRNNSSKGVTNMNIGYVRRQKQINTDQLLINFYNEYWTGLKTVKELCDKHNIDPETCNEFINRGRELNNIDGRAI